MDFALSPEQAAMRDAVRRYCDEQGGFAARQRSGQPSVGNGNAVAVGLHSLDWKAFSRMGWLGVALPVDVGGLGGSVVEHAIVFEELGRALVKEPVLPCVALAAQLIDRAASDEQRKNLLQSLLRGELLAALVYVDAQDAAGRDSIFVAKREADGGFTLSGRKSVVYGTGGAQHLLVAAVCREATADERWAIFMLDGRAEGIQRRNFPALDGTLSSEFVFHDVQVGCNAMLADQQRAVDALRYAMDHAMLMASAEMVGAMDGLLRLTRDYLKQRRQYGVVLSSLQALQHRMADMFADLELARSMLYQGLSAFGVGEQAVRSRMVAMAKAYIGRNARRVGEAAIQLHGGMGVAEEYMAAHYFKRLITLAALFVDQASGRPRHPGPSQ